MTKKKQVLFIVEGERTEVSILKKINTILECCGDYHIYSYKTAIYELYEELRIDENLELQLTLKSKTLNNDERTILEMRFVAIFLIFDFDPQHHKFSCESLKKMLSYFSDSSDKGKLYINYPMFESHRHLKTMPDLEFIHSTIRLEQVRDYKRLVGKESSYTETNRYTYPIIANMIAHHLCKFRSLVDNIATLPKSDEYSRLQSSELHIKLLSIQETAIADEIMYVINTSLFYVIDMIPISFFRNYSKVIDL